MFQVYEYLLRHTITRIARTHTLSSLLRVLVLSLTLLYCFWLSDSLTHLHCLALRFSVPVYRALLRAPL